MLGPPDSFAQLYRAHAPSVFRRARRLLQSDEEAHDVVSDVFTSLYERPEQYRGASTLSTFLYSMTTHACFNRLRSDRRRTRMLHATRDAAPETRAASPDRAVELRDLLQRMPEPLAHVAVYYYLDELTHEEIAEILDCSRRHVGDLIARLATWAERAKESA